MYIGRHLEEKALDMSKFDNKNIVKVAERHLATIQDPKRRRVLENFIEHADAELEARVDDLLASCSNRFQDYRNWGGTQDNALSRGPQSYEEMTEYYKTLVNMNAFVLQPGCEGPSLISYIALLGTQASTDFRSRASTDSQTRFDWFPPLRAYR